MCGLFYQSLFQAYGSDVSQWVDLTLQLLAGIISGLDSADIAKLKFTSMEATSAIGRNGQWTPAKVN